MNAKTEAGVDTLDKLKLFLAAGVVVGGVAGFYYLEDQPTVVRALVVLASLAVAAFIAYQATQGKTFWRFVQSSRVEMRKVVWPTRQETLTTTGVVMLFAAILAVFFWLLDMVLLWVTRLATGFGG
ncbi:MAG: preprotein translocase subunit SecE [Gammaproteobacteria bacterium]|nr:preprotein translocase subunit SecE [Gammaproteobacteria bacterium]